MPVLKDFRYSIRVLRQKPGFTLAAIVVLALGIGANSAMFTVINATLLQPLPYADPDRLVRLYESKVMAFGPYNVVSPANFRDWQKQVQSLLFHVSTSDAQVFAAVTIVLAIVALAACAGPALRAARVDPSTALRTE